MSSVNKVILIGRLGQNPEVKYTPAGQPVAKFSVATDEAFKDRAGEQQKRTEWHQVVAWNKLAEICGQYLTKGKQVYIEGSIRSRQWEDNSGVKRTAFEIVANEMKMLGDKSDSRNGEPVAAPSGKFNQTGNARSIVPDRPVTAADPINDEDVPF